MQVDWKKFLTALDYAKINASPGALQICPLHTGTEPSLKIQRDHITHNCRFLCQHDRCCFSGDAVTLLSRVKSITIPQVLELFKPDGSFYHTLENTIIASHVEEFQKYQLDQLHIAGYLSRCQQTFRTDSAAPLRTLMANAGAMPGDIRSLDTIPRALGIVISEDLPTAFKEFSKHKYRNSYYAVYPYTFEHKCACIRIQNFSEQSRPAKELTVTRSGIGIFMEDHLKPTTTEAFVTSDELSACALHHKLASWSAKPPAVIALAGLPIPFHYKNLKKLNLVSFADAPLTLKKALSYFISTDVVEGITNVKFHVISCNYNLLGAIAGMTVVNSLGASKPLGEWLITRISELIEGGRIEEVYAAFSATPLTNATRIELLRLASEYKAPSHVISTLKTINGSEIDQFTLGTGNVVRRTPIGFQAVKPNGNTIPLSNVVLDVIELVRTEDGIDYICKIQSPDYATALTLRITNKDLRNIDALKMVIDKAFLDIGIAPYVAFYHVEGYGWPDIVAKLSSDKRVSKELVCLGVDQELQVQFPNITLNTVDRRIIPQSKVLPISAEMKSIYSGLTCTETLDSLSPIRNLIEVAHSNIYLAGLLAGICHITAQLHKHLLSAKHGIRLNPSHIFYVSSNISDWLPIFQQLAHIFSGAAEAPILTSKSVKAYLEESRCLGDLPWIVNMMGINANNIPGILDMAPCSLISCLDFNAASIVGDRGNCSYVELDTAVNAELKCLHYDSILEIRNALPGFFLEMIVAAKETLRTAYSTGQPQAVAGYSIICNALGIPIDDMMEKLVKPYFVDQCFTGCHAFMNILHRMYMSSRLQIVNRMPNSKEETLLVTRIFSNDDIVLLNKKLLPAINRLNKGFGTFKEANITAELEDSKYQMEIPVGLKFCYNQYWALDKSIWDTYVKKQPILLPLVIESSPPMVLQRIA